MFVQLPGFFSQISWHFCICTQISWLGHFPTEISWERCSQCSPYSAALLTTTSTEEHPYITISGNLVDEHIPCQGIPLTIGSKSNVHFQSLLSIEVRVPRNPIEPRLPQDTINMKVSAMMSKESDKSPRPDLDSKAEFPELKPSGEKRQIQRRTLTKKKQYAQCCQTNQSNW